MPFGSSSAPEYFQKQMNRVLCGLDGVLCLIDDVLVYGNNEGEHKTRLEAVLRRIQNEGVTLNKEKCEVGKREFKFLGFVIDGDGIRADPDKT